MERKHIREVGDVVRQVLKQEGLLDGLDFLQLKNEWRAMIGPQAARECTSISFADGILKIKVRSSVLRNQLSIQKPLLIAKLNARQPQIVVKELLIF